MADTSLIEVARQTHQEAERYQQALVDILITSTSFSAPLTHKERLKRAHKASDLLDRISSRYRFLDDFYNDTNNEKAKELDAVAAEDTFAEFYSRLAKVKEYHQKYPGAVPDAFSIDFDALESGDGAAVARDAGLDFVDRMFSGEEMAGRFLDLHVHHEAFLNLKGVKRSSYLRYIDEFDKLVAEEAKVPPEAKKEERYKTYLSGLYQYLSGFLRKTQPLSNVDLVEARALALFEEDWEAGKVLGWEEQGDEIFGNGKGKAKATGDGIWCQACRRSYSKQTVYEAHLKSPKHLKAAERLASSGSAAPTNRTDTTEADALKRQQRAKSLAREELLIMALGHQLSSLRSDTKSNVERKAALTDRERQAEAEAASDEANRMTSTVPVDNIFTGDAPDKDDDQDTERIYNPLRLPLGWDGRPIPYWLYKLHGLGVEYKCEICSDFVYQGRKNFERHFQESRHAFGMRALGLPNTVQFRDVTTIQDALALADKLKKQGRLQTEQEGDAEEVEDEHGNTYTKKTYELLKRQGLL